MNIISIDLPWKSITRGRRVLAIANLDKNIEIKIAKDDDKLLQLVQDNAVLSTRGGRQDFVVLQVRAFRLGCHSRLTTSLD